MPYPYCVLCLGGSLEKDSLSSFFFSWTCLMATALAGYLGKLGKDPTISGKEEELALIQRDSRVSWLRVIAVLPVP